MAATFRNYWFSANEQVIVDTDTWLVIAAARPVPGTTADAHASRESGPSRHCEGVTVLGDRAYLSYRMAPQATGDGPCCRPRCARVEHVIGRSKNYKILRDCRQRGDGLHHEVQAVAHMHNLALAS
nr:hypothetical protein [Streptomyces lucensis]